MQVRIGIFLCDCGKSLNNIDLPKLIERAEKCQDVVCVRSSSGLCLKEGLGEMLSTVREERLDRVVIGACAPEIKENVFGKVIEEAGLNYNFLSIANIREQCSWAHEGDVTDKALDLIRMAVNKARFLQPIEWNEMTVNKDVLVLGGGFSGMKSALELSQLGIRTTLVEREAVLGGRLGEFEGFYGFETTPEEMLSSMKKAIEENGAIEVLTSAEVTRVEGKAGHFTARIRKGEHRVSQSFGAIMLATGHMTEILPQDFQLEPGVNIISQRKLVEMLQAPERFEQRPETIGFILDVSDENSRLPTLSTLNNALAVKERLGSEVYVFCKSVKVDTGGMERLYREARERGVVFLKFEERPQISNEDGRVKVEVRDILLGQQVALLCDFLVAEEKALPHEGAQALSSMLNIGTDSRGFYQDENVYLYPVASNVKGVFLVGGCRGDSDFVRASMDISSASMSIYRLLCSGKVMVEVEKVRVEPEKCRACLTCLRVCPHSAIQMVRVDTEKEVAKIYDLACDGCGICAAICPAKAIKFEGYAYEQILAEIEAVGESL